MHMFIFHICVLFILAQFEILLTPGSSQSTNAATDRYSAYLRDSSFKLSFSGMGKEIGLFQVTRRCVCKLRQVPASPQHHSPLLLYHANGLPYLINPYRFEVARCYDSFAQIQTPPPPPPCIALFLFRSFFV